MEAKAEPIGQKADGLKWVIVLALVVAGVVGNYYYDGSNLYRIIGLVVVAVVAALIALQTAKGLAFSQLLKEARVEIRKVVWPTRQELGQTTLIVVVFVLFVALVLWALDSIISLSVSAIIG